MKNSNCYRFTRPDVPNARNANLHCGLPCLVDVFCLAAGHSSREPQQLPRVEAECPSPVRCLAIRGCSASCSSAAIAPASSINLMCRPNGGASRNELTDLMNDHAPQARSSSPAGWDHWAC